MKKTRERLYTVPDHRDTPNNILRLRAKQLAIALQTPNDLKTSDLMHSVLDTFLEFNEIRDEMMARGNFTKEQFDALCNQPSNFKRYG